MADSKKSGGSKKPASQTRAEAAEALRMAAELISSLNETEESASPAPKKKPAAKKPAASSATKKTSSAAKKTAAKKTTAKAEPKKTAPAKKPAPKKATPEKERITEQTPAPEKETAATNEASATERLTDATPVAVAEASPEKEEQDQAPAPVAEEQDQAPFAETVEPERHAEPSKSEPESENEPEPEQHVEPSKPEPKPTVVVAEQSDEKPQSKTSRTEGGSFKQKAKAAVDKARLPIFVIANALLALSAILLIIAAFDITYYVGDKSVTEWYSVIGYFKNAAEIKARLGGVAFGWANGGYTAIGILMVLSFLVPLALIVKNIILSIKNKDKRVGALDGAVSAAFITAYLGIVNLYGANMTAGHIAALIVALVLVGFALFCAALRGEGIFAVAFAAVNIALVTLAMFLLTASPVYDQAGWYAAAAASTESGASAAFVMLLATVAAFALTIVMRFIRLPKITDAIVPAAAGALSVVALILVASVMPDGFGLNAGFVCGVVVTVLTAVVNVLFALLPPLKKLKTGAKIEPAAEEASAERTVQNSAEEQTNATTSVKCPACGTENENGSLFCIKCGKRL